MKKLLFVIPFLVLSVSCTTTSRVAEPVEYTYEYRGSEEFSPDELDAGLEKVFNDCLDSAQFYVVKGFYSEKYHSPKHLHQCMSSNGWQLFEGRNEGVSAEPIRGEETTVSLSEQI